MICEHLGCTGVHNKAKPASTWCPAAKVKHLAVGPTKEYIRAWNARNRDKLKTYSQNDYAKHRAKRLSKQRLKRFGVSDSDYARMLERQDHACAICRKPCSTGRNLAIDHCHLTNKIRGLLCLKCNRALGLFGDDTSALNRAAAYLLQ